MTIGERTALILAAFFAAVGLPVGVAVYRTWTAAHTTAALTGVLLVAGIACMAMSQALGVALHDRRTQAGPPTIHVGAPGTAGQHQFYDPMYLARLQEMQSRIQDREQRRYLADFGMEDGHGGDETGQFQVADWGVPDGQPAIKRPEGGWGERA